MTDQMQTIQDDLAYIRTLADEGRRGPPLNGSILLAAGLIWSATSLAAYAEATGVVAVPAPWQSLVWLIGFVAFMVTLFVLSHRSHAKPGAAALSNRVMRVTWSALGWGAFTFVTAAWAASWTLHTGLPMALIAPFILTTYGVGWAVASFLSERPWMRWAAAGSFAASVLLGFFAASREQYLVYAAALLLLMALPGWRLMRQEPRLAAV